MTGEPITNPPEPPRRYTIRAYGTVDNQPNYIWQNVLGWRSEHGVMHLTQEDETVTMFPIAPYRKVTVHPQRD